MSWSWWGRVMACFLRDGEDCAEEEWLFFFTDVSSVLLALVNSFSCFNLSNFSRMGSY